MLQSVASYLKVCGILIIGLALFSVQAVQAETGKEKILPTPQKTIGKPVMEALSLRKTTRNISDQALSEQNLSNLLWAAFGANRADGKRTVPTAHNKQNATIYLVLETGVWKYDGIKNSLTQIKTDNFTSKFGAPLTLLYVAPQEPADVSGMHVGSMYQNVALYCASENLANAVQTSKRNKLDGDLTLPKGEKVFVVQLVGIPEP